MKIALIGYGKMGHIIEKVALRRGHEIVCIIDMDNQEAFASEAFRSADVAIEFTNPQAAYGNYVKAFEQGVKVVSGSTGWRAEHEADVKEWVSKGHTLFWASNFSLGVAIFGAVNQYLAQIMNGFEDYDVRLSETHHKQKLDAPSGTAITLAEQVIGQLDRKNDWQLTQYVRADGEVERHEPKDKGILEVEAWREDDVPGVHEVTWRSEADEIKIAHVAHSREGFALGAVLAAEYTKEHEGLLSMEDLFCF